MKQTKRAEAHLNDEDRRKLEYLAHEYGTEAQAIRMAIRTLYNQKEVK